MKRLENCSFKTLRRRRRLAGNENLARMYAGTPLGDRAAREAERIRRLLSDYFIPRH